MTIPVRKAIFPVGGLGTRFLPVTKAMPKEMLPVVDKPLIQYAVEEASAAGIEKFIFVTGRGKQAIEDHFDRSYELEQILEVRGRREALEAVTSWMPQPGQIAYTRQIEPRGLGHAVWCARDLVGKEPFAVLLADDLIQSETPCLKQMLTAYGTMGGNIVATMEVPKKDTTKYGIIDPGTAVGPHVIVTGLVEKPAPEVAPSTLAVIGRYILQPEVFSHLDVGYTGTDGEIQLTDSMNELIGQQPFHALRFVGKRFDCGSKLGFLEANISFALERGDLDGDVGALLRAYSDVNTIAQDAE